MSNHKPQNENENRKPMPKPKQEDNKKKTTHSTEERILEKPQKKKNIYLIMFRYFRSPSFCMSNNNKTLGKRHKNEIKAFSFFGSDAFCLVCLTDLCSESSLFGFVFLSFFFFYFFLSFSSFRCPFPLIVII